MNDKPVKLVTRREEFWRAKQRHADLHRCRLGDWLARESGMSVCVGFASFRSPIVCRGTKLLAWSGKRRLELLGELWNGWLVLSQRAPKWVRNWAKRELPGRTVLMWAPLTKRNVRESVRFAAGLEKASKVAAALAPQEELPF